MKKWLVGAGLIALLVLGLWAWSSLSDSDTARMFSGAMKEKVEAEAYAVPASGTNLRVYEWTSKSGMACVEVCTNKGGCDFDCEFPPK